MQCNDKATVALFYRCMGLIGSMEDGGEKTHTNVTKQRTAPADVTWPEAKRNKEKPCVKLRLFRHAL